MLRHRSSRRPLRSAFTLAEVAVVIGVFVLMLSLSLPYLGDFSRRQHLQVECQTLRQTLYRAAYRSIAGERGLSWGVRLTATGYTLYAGDRYNLRLPEHDDATDLPPPHILYGYELLYGYGYELLFGYANGVSYGSGEWDVHFARSSGQPSIVGLFRMAAGENSTPVPCMRIEESGLIHG